MNEARATVYAYLKLPHYRQTELARQLGYRFKGKLDDLRFMRWLQKRAKLMEFRKLLGVDV